MPIRDLGFVVLTGPTGTGKTALYEDVLKKNWPVEAINVDTGQFLDELKVGTARPEGYGKESCFGQVGVLDEFSFIQFKKQAEGLAQEILERGAIPIYVGGSMFYIKSLFWPIKEIQAQDCGPTSIPAHIKKGSQEDKYRFLKEVDPKRAGELDHRDSYRVNRALDIWEKTGITPSLLKPEFKPQKSIIFYVDMPLEAHRDQIRKRTEEMLASGWIEEVAWLPLDKRAVLKNKLIGYDSVLDFIDGRLCRSDLCQRIVEQTLAYAKQQRKFFKRFEALLLQADVDGTVKIIKLGHDGSGSLPSIFWENVNGVLGFTRKIYNNCHTRELLEGN